MDVCLQSSFLARESNIVADDLGVIAAVLVSQSFKAKFEANDTETSVSRLA
jgi:hypothetical protein